MARSDNVNLAVVQNFKKKVQIDRKLVFCHWKEETGVKEWPKATERKGRMEDNSVRKVLIIEEGEKEQWIME